MKLQVRKHRMRLRRFDGKVYLDRWGLAIEQIGGIYLHRMTAPDPGLDLHDHPFAFVSWVIKGAYTEERAETRVAPFYARLVGHYTTCNRGYDVERPRWSFKMMRLDECHRITELVGSSCWTIVFRGPRRRGWGFYIPGGFVDEKTYDDTIRVERKDLWSEGGYVENLLNRRPVAEEKL